MKEKTNFYIYIVIFVLFGLSVYGFWKISDQKKSYEAKLSDLGAQLDTNKRTLDITKNDLGVITAQLQTEQIKNGTYVKKIDDIQNTVDTLTKLSQTDKELLQKYSKVYFLSENYVPSELTAIDTKYLLSKNKPMEVHDRAWSFLKTMLDDAQFDGVPLLVVSAYRSFGTQATLKSSYKFTYGAGTANQFSAEQGYSEHQLGTAIDLTTPTLGNSFEGIEKTPAFAWLTSHAYKYGFILSYPKSNGYYQYEPWHWRFIGIELATKLHNENKNFYDLDQREIDTYLVNIFNK